MNANLQMLRRSPSAEQLKLQNLRLRVGDHAIDVGALRVIGHGESSRLTAKAVAVLLELVRHAGNTVGRDELLETVWKDRVTTPDVLTQAIKELRRAFADSDKPSQYIETIPKVGYRLLAEVSVIEADEVPFQLVSGVDEATDQVPPGPLDVIANYTAFQQIRVTLGRAG